jgi:DNA-binding response OmpR family regulator
MTTVHYSAPNLRPRPGGTHAVVIGARDDGMRLLLWHTFQDDRYLIVEEATEDGVVLQVRISRPALVVVDGDLAQGNGVDACRRIKSELALRDTAVVVVSSRVDEVHRQRALDAGADSFVPKPFSPIALQRLAERVCDRAPWRRSAGDEPAVDVGAAAHPRTA